MYTFVVHSNAIMCINCAVLVTTPSKWDPRRHRGLNMGIRKMHSTQGGLVLNLCTSSISSQYYIVFDDMFCTVLSSPATDLEVCTSLVISRNTRNQAILDQEDCS